MTQHLKLRYDLRVISNKALVDFATTYPDASTPLQAWRKVMESGKFQHFAGLKSVMNSVDRVGDFYVFDIGGNKYRLVTAIHFNRQMAFIRQVLTHTEYDDWKP